MPEKGDARNLSCGFPVVLPRLNCYFPTGRAGMTPPRSMSKVALVVDDSMLIRCSLCRFLEARGFTVEVAADGAEAVELLSRIQPDVIVTDMRMPKMSGGEFITVLKSKPETAEIPVLVVTSKANGACEADERADFAIYKDIDVECQLDAALESVMGSKSKGQASGN